MVAKERGSLPAGVQTDLSTYSMTLVSDLPESMVSLFKCSFIYLRGQGEKISLITDSLSKNPATARAGQGCDQQSRMQFRLHTWVGSAIVVCPARGTVQESWVSTAGTGAQGIQTCNVASQAAI